MATEEFKPEVSASDADRAVASLSRFQAEVARNPLVNGELVEVDATDDAWVNVPHGLGRRAVGAIVVGSDRGVFTASMLESSRGEATVGMASQWEVLERKDITEDTTSFDFDFKCNGDLDAEYRIDGYWFAGGTTPELRYRVNGASSTALTGPGYARVLDGGAASNGASMIVSIGVAAEGSNPARVQSELYAESGQVRFSRSTAQHSEATTFSLTNEEAVASKWHDTAPRVNSLGLYTSVASAILDGSNFTLYRRPRLSGRRLKIWIF